ncbi:hypothetical protein [Fluviicola sp.]|uniref:hypothetical protein n=1 Tax=Fluviicola sp. TaxID=1917219 RepID=UPI003D26ACFF
MKQVVLVLILMLGKSAFSQQIDSLHVSYYVGCDCSHVMDSVELRGGCEKKNTP